MLSPFITVIIIIITVLVHTRWIRYYAKGMAEYVRLNNLTGKETCWISIRDEFWEFIEAIQDLIRPDLSIKIKLYNLILEFFDLTHSIIKYFIIDWLPGSISGRPEIWAFIFPFIIPVGMKLANRYRSHNCIRNHPAHTDHDCYYH